MIQTKNDTAVAVPHLMPLEGINTSLRGNARNISMILENSQPARPTITITDQRSCDMSYFFPANREKMLEIRSFQTINTASLTMVPDIFDVPA